MYGKGREEEDGEREGEGETGEIGESEEVEEKKDERKRKGGGRGGKEEENQAPSTSCICNVRLTGGLFTQMNIRNPGKGTTNSTTVTRPKKKKKPRNGVKHEVDPSY